MRSGLARRVDKFECGKEGGEVGAAGARLGCRGCGGDVVLDYWAISKRVQITNIQGAIPSYVAMIRSYPTEWRGCVKCLLKQSTNGAQAHSMRVRVTAKDDLQDDVAYLILSIIFPKKIVVLSRVFSEPHS